MDQINDNRCILVLQRDVFVQFQSIQLATKLDTNAQMEMFFQLYHCVETAHFKAEEMDSSTTADIKKNTFTNSSKEDSVNHKKLPTNEDTYNRRLQVLTKNSAVMDETNGLSSNTSNGVSSDGDAQCIEMKNPSVSFSLNNQKQTDLSDTSGADCDLDHMMHNSVGSNNHSQRIPDDTQTGNSGVKTSIDNTESCEPDMTRSVPNKQLETSPHTSANTPVRKGRRKSAPKRAAPVDDEDSDALDMQLLLKQECLDDDSYLSADAMDAAADEDHLNMASNSKMVSDSYLPQTLTKYTKDASFELPTMVRGTNYGPMTSTPSSRQHTGSSSAFNNNHDTYKNIHRNSMSAQVLKKQGHLRTLAMGLKRKSVGFSELSETHDSSANCESEMDSTDRLSDFGDISDDFSFGATILKCEFCSFTSHRRYNLNRHRRIHTGTMFKCESCGRKFNEPGKLKSHSCKLPVPKSPNKPLYTCDICGTSGLKSIEALRQHVQLEHDIVETYVCVSCNPQVIFHSPQEFKNHLETLHTVSRSLSKSLCNECGREFKYLRSLQKHKLTCVITMYKLKPTKVEDIPSTSLNTD